MLKTEKRCTVYAVAMNADGVDALNRFDQLRGSIPRALANPLDALGGFDFDPSWHDEEIRFSLEPKNDTPETHAAIREALAAWIKAARALPA